MLSTEDHDQLEAIVRTRTLQAQVVTRARILLLKEGGVENAIYDAPGRGRNAEVTDDEKTWMINVACQNQLSSVTPLRRGPMQN